MTTEDEILEVFKKLDRPLLIRDLLSIGINREFINKVLRKMIKNNVITRTFTPMHQYRGGTIGMVRSMQFVYTLNK